MGSIIFHYEPLKIDLTVGIDHFSFQVKAGNQFCGIKGIPDGVHVIHISSNTDDDVRYGYWFSDSRGLYMRHDSANEVFQLLIEPDHDKYYRMFQMGNHLMVNYPQIDETNWPELTNFISMDQIETIVDSRPPYVDSSMTTQEEARILTKKIGRTASDTNAPFKFTEINFKSLDAIRPNCRMIDYLDKSYYLNHVIVACQLKGHINRLLGELQFAFCVALLFGNYGCSMQWHNIVELIAFSSGLSPAFAETCDKIFAQQLLTLPPEYTDTLLNTELWARCLDRSQQRDNLTRTRQAYESRFDDNLPEQEELAVPSQHIDTLPNIDGVYEDDSDENSPTVASGLYYVRR